MEDIPIKKIFTKRVLYELFIATIIILLMIVVFILKSDIRKQQQEKINISNAIREKNISIAKIYILMHSNRISNKMVEEIAVEAMNTNIPIVILAIIKIESSYNPTSVSNMGAIGLMQVMEVHIPLLIKEGIIKEKRDLFDIGMNIKAGLFIWSNMWIKNKGDIYKTFINYYGKHDGDYFIKFSKSYFELKYSFNQSL